MLAIRGISDIVGLKRADAWTKYACASAAAFTRAFLRTRPFVAAPLHREISAPLCLGEDASRRGARLHGALAAACGWQSRGRRRRAGSAEGLGLHPGSIFSASSRREPNGGIVDAATFPPIRQHLGMPIVRLSVPEGPTLCDLDTMRKIIGRCASVALSCESGRPGAPSG
jgi:hypothetical protein